MFYFRRCPCSPNSKLEYNDALFECDRTMCCTHQFRTHYFFFDAFGHDLFWVMPQLCRNHLDFSIWDLRLTAIDSRMDHGPLQGLPPNVLGLTVSRSWARWAESKLAIDYCLPGATCSWRLGNSFHESCTSRPRPSST